MAKKKKQHYVPQFYLNEFLAENIEINQSKYLWVFEKNNKVLFRRSPKNVAFENYYYSFKYENEQVEDIENILSSLESDVSKLFKEFKTINLNTISEP